MIHTSFYILLILFVNNVLRIFVTPSMEVNALQVLFGVVFVLSLSGFGIRVMLASLNELGNFPSSSVRDCVELILILL